MPLLTTTQIGADFRLQEELGRQQLFAYLVHLLMTRRTLADEIESLPPISPNHNVPYLGRRNTALRLKVNTKQVPTPISPVKATASGMK